MLELHKLKEHAFPFCTPRYLSVAVLFYTIRCRGTAEFLNVFISVFFFLLFPLKWLKDDPEHLVEAILSTTAKMKKFAGDAIKRR